MQVRNKKNGRYEVVRKKIELWKKRWEGEGKKKVGCEM